MIEVKCSYSTRFENPEILVANKKLKYFNENRELRRNHNYFYQIQGLLNITEINWCDLFIWTWVGRFSIRIKRDIEFWEDKMLKPLCDFYLSFILPELVKSQDFNTEQKKTLKPDENSEFIETNINIRPILNFFDNGLVRNFKYYDKCSEYGNYVVAKYQESFSVELRYEDFKTLYGRQWLTDYAINYCLSTVSKLFPHKSHILLTTNQITP